MDSESKEKESPWKERAWVVGTIGGIITIMSFAYQAYDRYNKAVPRMSVSVSGSEYVASDSNDTAIGMKKHFFVTITNYGNAAAKNVRVMLNSNNSIAKFEKNETLINQKEFTGKLDIGDLDVDSTLRIHIWADLPLKLGEQITIADETGKQRYAVNNDASTVLAGFVAGIIFTVVIGVLTVALGIGYVIWKYGPMLKAWTLKMEESTKQMQRFNAEMDEQLKLARIGSN